MHGFDPKLSSSEANAIWLATTVAAAQADVFRPAGRVEFVVSCLAVLTMCPERISQCGDESPEVRWRRTVKTLNSRVKHCDNRVVSRCSEDTVPNTTVIRRHNALALFQE